jgi:hypothetical protein
MLSRFRCGGKAGSCDDWTSGLGWSLRASFASLTWTMAARQPHLNPGATTRVTHGIPNSYQPCSIKDKDKCFHPAPPPSPGGVRAARLHRRQNPQQSAGDTRDFIFRTDGCKVKARVPRGPRAETWDSNGPIPLRATCLHERENHARAIAMSDLRSQINNLSAAEKAELLDTLWESLEARSDRALTSLGQNAGRGLPIALRNKRCDFESSACRALCWLCRP